MEHRYLIVKLLRLAVLVAVGLSVPLVTIVYVGPLLFRTAPAHNTDTLQFTVEDLAPRIAANGIAVADLDEDGDDDVFAASYPDGDAAPSVLLENRNGSFVDVTDELGLPAIFASSGFFARVLNDRPPELFIMEVRPSSAIYETTSVLRTFSYDPASKRFRETTARHEFNTPFSSPEGTLSFADYDLDGDLDLAVSYLGANRWYWFPQTPLHTTVGMLMYGGIFSEILCERGELSRTISENKFPGLSKRVVNDFGSVEQFLDNGGCVMTKPAGLPGVSRSPIFEPFNIPTVLLAFTRGVIHLYENQGGAFVFRGALEAPIEASAHATGAAGTQDWTYLSHRFFQILSIDVTDDGLPDIVAASSDASRNALFINEGQMSFREAGRERGLAVSGTGMGITMNDYRRGGVQHMLVTNFGHIFDFQNRAAGDFEINQALSLNHLGFGWGIASLDVDNDGWTDLYLSNGVRPAATPYESGVSQAMDDPERITMVRNRLYVNKHGNFIDGTEEYVPDLALSSRPVAVGDIDSDGYPDFFVGGVGRPGGRGLYFFHNKGGSNAWVQLRLRGTDSNIDAVGASATIESGESKERKHILLGSSFSSQDSHVLMFGLGDSDAETVPVEVRWPSGNVQHMMVPVNERTEILESQR